MRRLAAIAALFGLSLGCAEPFGVNRQTLGPARIAALGVVDGQASAVVWAGQPWHSAPVALSWRVDGEPLGDGWGLDVPDGETLSLTATLPDGEVLQAQVSVTDGLDAVEVTREAVDLGDSWRLEARRDAEAGPLTDGAVPAGLAARLTAEAPAGATARWMLAEDDGTVLQLTDTSADVLREDLSFEDGELTRRVDVPDGYALALGLAMDGAGANRWAWAQVPMGVDAGTLLADGFVVDLDGIDTSTGLVALTVQALDAVEATLTPADPAAVEDLDQQEPVGCAPADVPFRLSWLAEGRCTVDEVLGARIVVETP